MPEVGPFAPAEWEAWLDAHHKTETEVWLVSWKKSTGKQELAYGEAVEVAMQFGWVDSLEKGIDAERFKQRWTPRRPEGNWTERNIALAERLIADGRMRPAGVRAYEARNPWTVPGTWPFSLSLICRTFAGGDMSARAEPRGQSPVVSCGRMRR